MEQVGEEGKGEVGREQGNYARGLKRRFGLGRG